MEPKELSVRFPALHGEKTGVGTLVAAREYHRLGKIKDIKPFLIDYQDMSAEAIKGYFGGELAEAIIRENEKDCLAGVTREQLAEHWNEILEILERLPQEEYYYNFLQQLDAKRSLEDIGISEEDRPAVLKFSAVVRNRLTLMRIRRMIKV